MSDKVDRALKAFYENLAQSHKDFATYYLAPTGISRIVKILKLLELHPNQAVCDIGCGDGCIASQAKRTIKKVKALDISNIRAQRAKSRGIDAICAEAILCMFTLSDLFPNALEYAQNAFLWTRDNMQDKNDGHFYYLKTARKVDRIPYIRGGTSLDDESIGEFGVDFV